ncbi:GlsB/YeaQ/YmgE family stress response membrane protein [Geothrix sp. PMB-07]|uniref:GlsB/YeaQ/YmgE family stress response membrane protein n=1 Tax=Geothrix sp. PMB-07 TaxID=3068640 RepID=UPI0027406976|nr:GlsB/YeaQ/YmgE family stress response membrane protein [Geothrix sp. PMB-07]WLT31265.1 GlsB/YeaQ/YmgE family stress response membrane protein [Geothrix sp. PMB-07]
MIHLIWTFILGIIVGLVARWILPGADHMGLFMTGLVGVAGSFAGHFLAKAIGLEADGKPNGRFFSALISVGGAVLLLLILRFFHH